MKTSEIEQALRDDFDENAKVLSIGPAGEQKLPWACVSTDQYHKAGRGGHGALLGDKNLKAVAVRGTGSVTVGDAKAFLADIWRIHDEYVLTDDNYWVHEEGTPVLVDLVNGAGAFPTRNWSEGEFEDAGNINSESFQKIRIKKRACYQCAIACRNVHRSSSTARRSWARARSTRPSPSAAPTAASATSPRWSSSTSCATSGAWTPSRRGRSLGLAMDLTEKGIKDFGVRFGEVEGYLERARAHGDPRRASAPSWRSAPAPRREVRRARAGHGGQEPRAAGLRPARHVRHEPLVLDLRPRRLPHALVPGRRRDHHRRRARRHAWRARPPTTSTARTSAP